MKTYYLTANKTKMIKLLKDKGYNPTPKKARFEKLYRRRSYTLCWLEGSGMHKAMLYTAAGKPHLSIINNAGERIIHLTSAELDQYNMKEEMQ